jgi:hypothetical protein
MNSPLPVWSVKPEVVPQWRRKTTCDQFTNVSSNAQCQTTLNVLVETAGLVHLLSEDENCDCAGKPAWYNQKYAITSSTTGMPTQPKWFGSVTETYLWKNVSMSQWCVGLTNKQPDLTPFSGLITVEYQAHPAPTQMPGAYINGDVRAWQSRDTVARLISFLIYALTGQVMIYNSKTGYGPTTFSINGGIYTWDGTTTAKRGAGGNPTTVCQSY